MKRNVYVVKHKGEEIEWLDTMREAEEFIDYKCKNWPSKYKVDDFDIAIRKIDQ